MKWCIFLFLALCGFGLYLMIQGAEYRLVAMIPLKQEFGTSKDWRVSAYQTTKDEAVSDIPSRLCFEAEQQKPNCIHIVSALPNGGVQYAYQAVKELSVNHEPHLLKYVAEFSGGGSGVLNQVSFWRYVKEVDSFQRAGLITLTEQGEYKTINEPALGKLLVTADARWSEGESHFSSHHFDVTVYRYDASSGYTKQFSYLTKVKYPSFDNIDKIDVISHELATIQKKLMN